MCQLVARCMLITMLLASQCFAQQPVTSPDTLHAADMNIYTGKVFDDAEMAKIQQQSDKKNQLLYGTRYPAFNVKTATGNTISSTNSKGKTVLIGFWLFSGGDNSLKEFEDVYEKLKNDTYFVFVTVNPEGGSVPTDFMKNNHLNFPVAFTTYEQAQEMNFKNGFPSFVLINKAGIICLIGHGIGVKDRLFTTAEDTLFNLINTLERN